MRQQASTLAAAARRQREAELDQARKEAARILQDARVEAGRILAEAKRDADRITGAARAQADGTLASAEEQATATARAGRFGLATLSPQPCPPRGAARAWAGPTILWLFDAIDAHYPAMHRLTRHEPLTRWHYTAGRSWDVKEPAGRAEATTEDAPSGMGRQWARLQDWLSAALPVDAEPDLAGRLMTAADWPPHHSAAAAVYFTVDTASRPGLWAPTSGRTRGRVGYNQESIAVVGLPFDIAEEIRRHPPSRERQDLLSRVNRSNYLVVFDGIDTAWCAQPSPPLEDTVQPFDDPV